MEFNSMIDLGADQLLAKAEKLLLDVTSCIKIETPRNRIQESKLVESLLQNSAETKHVKTYDPESDLTQIEWLLRGVPEAYEDEPQVNDEMVLALLKEGGCPPSQLILPSIYATNQLVLEKLSNARRLRIHITNILVLSVRYGVRKEGTFLRIYPPSGCALPANEAASIMMPLHELQDPQGQLGALLRKNDKRDSLRNYFVGALDMNRSMEMDLTMSEKVVRDWLHSKPEGSLRIELYGYLAPHATVMRGTHSEAVLLATALVPLGGLLGTPSLDAVVHCDLHVDAYSHATVLSRMRNITSAQSVSKQKTLGPKLGTVTVRVSVLPAKEKSSTAARTTANYSSTRDHKLLHEVEPLLLPVKDANDMEGVEPTDIVHSALGYVPTEHPTQSQPAPAHPLPFQRHDINRRVYGSSEQVNGAFALALCGLEGLSVPIEKAVEIQQHADRSGVKASAQIVLSFKTHTRERESVPVDFDLASREKSLHLNVSNGKMYYTDTTVWVAPVIEVWLTWKAAGSPPSTPAPTPQQADAAQDTPESDSSVIECRHLLGLAKFASDYKLGTLIELPVVDVARGVQRGVLVTAAVLGKEENLVENSLLCLLNFYTLRRSTVRAPGPSAATMGPSPSTQDQQRQQGEDESKRDSVDDAAYGGANETEERPGIEPEADHDEVDETDDSIGDIIAFLNDHNHAQDHPKPRPGQHPLATSTSSMNEFLAQEDRAADIARNHGVPTSGVLPSDKDESRLDRDSADVTISNAMVDIKTRQEADRTRLHLLDFSIEGEFSAVRPVHEAYTPANIFGCYVKYTLPDLRDVNGVDSFALWWDGDCAVLNGSLRHQLELSIEDGRHQESVSDKALGKALGLSSCVKFFFYLADAEGNIPPDPVIVGEAALPLSTLTKFINGNSGFAVFELPISLYHAALSRLDEGFEVVQSNPKFLLKVSHRIEPVLLRRSRDSSHYSVQPPLPALKHENISPRASTEQPAWRVRYTTDAQQLEVSQSQEQTDVKPERQAHTNAPFSVNNATDNALETNNHRADPVSRLLGFELTQEDLDGILYFRDPAAPLPWVPFEGSEVLEDPRRRPVLTSALGGKAITTKAKDEEVDLDAALQKSIYELEYIEHMFRRDHENDIHLPTGRSENKHTYRTDDLQSADEDDEDTEMYKSDFESLDDEPDIDKIARLIEGDHMQPKMGIAFQPLTASSNNLEESESVESDNSQYFSDGPPADELQSDSDREEEELSSVSTSHSAAEASIFKRVAALKSLVSEHLNLAAGKVEVEHNPEQSLGDYQMASVDESKVPESNKEADDHQGAVQENAIEEEHTLQEESHADAHDDNLCLSVRSNDANDSPEMRDLDEESTSFEVQMQPCSRRAQGGQEDSEGIEREGKEDSNRAEESFSDLDSLQVSAMELAVVEVNSSYAALDESDAKSADLAAEELQIRFDSPENVAFADEVLTPVATREEDVVILQQEQKEEGHLKDEELQTELETATKMEENVDEVESDHEEEESNVHDILAHDAAMQHIDESTQTEPREMSLSMDMDFTMGVSVSKLADSSAHSAVTVDSFAPGASAVSAESATAAADADVSQSLREDDANEPSFAHYSLHVALRADPFARNSFESVECASTHRKEDTFLADDQSEHRLNISSESARSVASVASVASAQSRAKQFDTGTDDSPDTSKIKNIVDKQIEKYFGPDVLLSHSSMESSFHHAVPPQSSFSSPQRGIDPQAVHQWYNRTDHRAAPAVAPAVAPIAPPAPGRPPTETELFRANLSKVQALLPVSLGGSTGTRGAARRHPGWQGRFLDKETDRASHIMSGVFSKSDHV